MATELYVGTYGVILEINMGADMSGATNLVLKMQKPDSSVVTLSPVTIVGQYLKYTIVAGNLNLAGTYSLQPTFDLGVAHILGRTMTFSVSSIIA